MHDVRPVAVLHTLSVAPDDPLQLLDITAVVEAAVRRAGLYDGIATVFSRHTTAAIRIQEDEPQLRADLLRILAELAPAEKDYQHNNFRIRTAHMHSDERPNGHAHCLHLLPSRWVDVLLIPAHHSSTCLGPCLCSRDALRQQRDGTGCHWRTAARYLAARIPGRARRPASVS